MRVFAISRLNCHFPRRLVLLSLLLLPAPLVSCLLLPSASHAEDIAVLKSSDIAAYNTALSAFTANLPETIMVAEYDLEGDIARGQKIARKLRASKIRAVLAIGLKAALAAKLELIDTPILFCMVLNPERYELNAPNMTGIELTIPVSSQLKFIQSIMPAIKRIGVVFNPANMGDLIREIRAETQRRGIVLVSQKVDTEQELPGVLRALVSNIDALWLLPDTTIVNEESLEFLLSTTLEQKIPLFGFSSGLVRSGSLAGFFIHYEDIGRKAASLAMQLLNGNSIPKGKSLPVDKVRLSLNLKTAKFLNIPITAEILKQAEETF